MRSGLDVGDGDARFSAGIHMLAQDGAREHLRKTGIIPVLCHAFGM